MKALRKTREGKGNIELQDVPEPDIKDDEILMRVHSNGVCGSDLLIEEDNHFYEAPVTLGHEFSGTAERVGPAVQSVKEGDKIVGDIETREGWLGVSRDGAYAPYMVIPEAQAMVLPDDVPLEHGAFAEPVVATIHAMQERNEVRAGDFVAVVGPGPMGLLGVQFAKLRGAREVALIGLEGIDERRLSIGEEVGADHLLYSEENPADAIRDLNDGKGADFVLECSASGGGLQHAIDCALKSPEGRGGRGSITTISLWGEPITIDADPISLNQLDIGGAWSWNGRETWERSVDLIVRGCFDFDALVTKKCGLEEWEQSFADLRDCREAKVLIQPNGS